MMNVRDPARERAAASGTYLSSAIAASTFALSVAETWGSPLMTRETLLSDTPECRATSSIVARTGPFEEVARFISVLPWRQEQVVPGSVW
jgi:hypothetical protein